MSFRLFAPLVAACALAQSAGDVSYWLNLRKSVLKDDAYFDQLRDAGMPAIEGTIVTMEPSLRPHTLMIGIETPLVAELRLEIQHDGQNARLNTTPALKSKIRFHMAMPKSVRKQPFVLTATVDEMNLDYEQDGEAAGPQ